MHSEIINTMIPAYFQVIDIYYLVGWRIPFNNLKELKQLKNCSNCRCFYQTAWKYLCLLAKRKKKYWCHCFQLLSENVGLCALRGKMMLVTNFSGSRIMEKLKLMFNIGQVRLSKRWAITRSIMKVIRIGPFSVRAPCSYHL